MNSAPCICPDCLAVSTITVMTHQTIKEWAKEKKINRDEEGRYITECWQCDWIRKGYLPRPVKVV